jgi:hypothetical protein
MDVAPTRRAALLFMASGIGIGIAGFLGATGSSPSPMPGWTPSVVAVGSLAFTWGAVAVVPERFRRLTTVWAILGTVWTICCTVVLTLVVLRISS